MTAILNLQRMQAVGPELLWRLEGDDYSTCSYVGCGNSTASCVGCCEESGCGPNTTV